MKTRKVGFIGAGNIAYAIISGIVKSGYIKSDYVNIFDAVPEAYKRFTSIGCNCCSTAEELVKNSDCVFFTVKPQICPSVLDSVASYFTPDMLVVTVCAGLTIDYFKKRLGCDARVVRVMPNTPLLVGSGASALVHNSPVDDAEFEFVRGIFEASGKTVVVGEELISAVTALSGSGPAYFFRFVEIVCREAEKSGISSDTALLLTAQTMLGASEMLLKSGKSAAELRVMVTSPNGTTQAALEAFDRTGFDDSVAAGFKACKDRADELSGVK